MERDDVTLLLVENLLRLMPAKGTNAAELGRAAGLGATGVYDILSGKSRSPRLDTVSKIAAALGVPVAFLLEEEPLRAMREQLSEVWEVLPPQEKARLLLTARAWAGSQEQA